MSILIKFLIWNAILYLFGAFVAWNLDVTDWFFIRNISGRIGLACIELIFLWISIDTKIKL